MSEENGGSAPTLVMVLRLTRTSHSCEKHASACSTLSTHGAVPPGTHDVCTQDPLVAKTKTEVVTEWSFSCELCNQSFDCIIHKLFRHVRGRQTVLSKGCTTSMRSGERVQGERCQPQKSLRGMGEIWPTMQRSPEMRRRLQVPCRRNWRKEVP